MKETEAIGFYNNPGYHSLVSAWQESGRISHQSVDSFELLLQRIQQKDCSLVFLGLDHVTISPLLEIVIQRCRELETPPILVVFMQEYSSFLRSKVLSAGADWVIELSDDPAIVNARLDAVLRRCRQMAKDPVLEFPPYRLDKGSLEIHYSGNTKSLSHLDFRLIEYLFIHNEIPHSRDKLLQMVWNQVSPENNRRVDTKVSQLRTSLDLNGSNGWALCADRRASGYRLTQTALRQAHARSQKILDANRLY